MITLNITGMTCGHCVQAVTQAVQAVPGVERVGIELETGIGVVHGHPDVQAVLDAVKEEGYDVHVAPPHGAPA
ncbi:Copper chaperone CopZ [compost metagenome]